ncbi:unnamed protein product [Prorocentrum cordatum]|uniref:Phospholipase B-like n=1 Tax=Prorocentrum cordatum TaxID=2364126 RepID=A0ABN9RF95_9DINO|nr:unnamed protein product [Polarella glacialis]
MDTHRSHQRVCCGSAQLPRSKLLDVVIEKDNEDGARIQGPRLVPMGGACLQSTSGLLRHELTASGARDFPSEFEHAISHATQSEWVDCAGYLISSHATAPPVCPQVTGRLSSILSLYAPLVVPEGYCRPQALGEVLFEQAEVNDADFSHYCTSLPDVDRVQDGAVCAATLNPASKLASETAKAGGGLHPDVTTVMFRHIPRWCSEWQVMREIDDAGFMGMYDFFYLPLGTRSKASLAARQPRLCLPELLLPRHRAGVLRRLPRQRALQPPRGARGARARRASRRPPGLRPQRRPLPLLARAHARRRSGAEPAALLQGGLIRQALPPHLAGLAQEGPGAAAPPARGSVPRQTVRWQAAQATAAPPRARFCAYCGSPKEGDGSFCPRCGQRWLA